MCVLAQGGHRYLARRMQPYWRASPWPVQTRKWRVPNAVARPHCRSLLLLLHMHGLVPLNPWRPTQPMAQQPTHPTVCLSRRRSAAAQRRWRVHRHQQLPLPQLAPQWLLLLLCHPAPRRALRHEPPGCRRRRRLATLGTGWVLTLLCRQPACALPLPLPCLLIPGSQWCVLRHCHPHAWPSRRPATPR